MSIDANISEEAENQRTLALCVLHLKRASSLVQTFDNDTSQVLLQLSRSLIEKYGVNQSSIDDIECIEKEIIGEDR